MAARLLLPAILLALPVLGRAQKPASGTDPYTGGKPAAMERLGILSFGPFALGDEHGSAAVDALVGPGRTVWLETAHFRIGCALPTVPLPDESRHRKDLYEECRRLHKLVAAIPAEPAEIDAWLHAHLFARRLEDLYAGLRTRLGVEDAWFAANPIGQDRGVGPNLGCRGKFGVLLYGQEAELGRYLRRYCDDVRDQPRRVWFKATDSQVFATSLQARAGRLVDPSLLHAHVVGAVASMLVAAYVGDADAVPWWFDTGVGLWYARRAHPRSVDLGELPSDEFTLAATWEWEARVAARVRRDLTPPWQSMVAWPDGDACRPVDHLMLWSCVDFLFAQGDLDMIRFFRHLRSKPMRGRLVPPALAERWHEAALTAAFGGGVAEMDARWRKFALAQGR